MQLTGAKRRLFSLTRSPILEVRVRTLILFQFVLACCVARSVPAQQPQSNPQPSQATGSHSIVLDVVVTDKAGKPVSDLQQQDFAILDDKTSRNLVSFHASTPGDSGDPPVQAVIVVDAVNTSSQNVIYEAQQLQKFFRQSDGKVSMPTSLVIFTDTSTDIQPHPTLDGNALANSLGSNQPGLRSLTRSAGFYGASERLQLSIQALVEITRFEATQRGRKLLIWISPGWPMLEAPGIMLSNKDQQMLFNSVVQFSEQMRDARITLYAVDPAGMNDAGSFRTFYYQSFLKGVPSARQASSGNLALQVLATQSGGLVLNSSNDFQRLLGTTLADAKAFYTVSFEAPPGDHANEYHSLQVKVDKPKLVARTRTGYYAEPYQSGGR